MKTGALLTAAVKTLWIVWHLVYLQGLPGSELMLPCGILLLSEKELMIQTGLVGMQLPFDHRLVDQLVCLFAYD